MSNLTDEFAAVIAELASELGEGLTATLTQRSGTFNASTQTYTGGETAQHELAIAPPSEQRQTQGGSAELRSGALTVVLPTTSTAGVAITPTVSDTLTVGATTLQILSVRALRIGDGIAGWLCEVRG